MKNKDKKKNCKNCGNENVDKKVKTMQKGKEYYQDVKENQSENENQNNQENE